MTRASSGHMKMFAVLKTEGGHGIHEYTSIDDEPPANALHTYVDREKAVAKVKELNGAKS